MRHCQFLKKKKKGTTDLNVFLAKSSFDRIEKTVQKMVRIWNNNYAYLLEFAPVTSVSRTYCSNAFSIATSDKFPNFRFEQKQKYTARHSNTGLLHVKPLLSPILRLLFLYWQSWPEKKENDSSEWMFFLSYLQILGEKNNGKSRRKNWMRKACIEPRMLTNSLRHRWLEC